MLGIVTLKAKLSMLLIIKVKEYNKCVCNIHTTCILMYFKRSISNPINI